MRVDRPTVASHRAAILQAAGRLFRRRGIAAVPVAEITREAGLTHGGFYGHFASKDALAANRAAAALKTPPRAGPPAPSAPAASAAIPSPP